LAKFIFHMNNILELKVKLEDQEKIFYGNARIKLTEEETKLRSLEERKTAYEAHYRELLTTKLNLLQIRTVESAIEVMKDKIKQQKVIVHTCEKQLEAARIRLNKAMVERKTYETLKEKAFEQFKKDVDAQEQKEVDELVSYKFNSPRSYEEEQ